MKPELKFGLLNSIIGVIVGIFHSYISIGKGYEILIFFAPISIFIIGTLCWKYKIKNTHYNLEDLIPVSLITGSLSHPITFFLCLVYANICNWTTGGCTSSLGDKPMNLLYSIPASLFFSTFSLIIYGWFTVLSSILVSLYMIYSNNKNVNSNPKNLNN